MVVRFSRAYPAPDGACARVLTTRQRPERVARQIERDQVQEHAARRLNAPARAQISGVVEREGRRHQPFMQQLLRAVQVRGDGVQEARALAQARREPAHSPAGTRNGRTSSAQGRLGPSSAA